MVNAKVGVKKSRKSRQVWGIIRVHCIFKSQKGREPGVGKGKRSLLACHIVANIPWKPLVIKRICINIRTFIYINV